MRRNWRSTRLLLGLLLALCVRSAAAEPVLVDDRAALLTKEQRGRIELHHSYLLQDHDIDYRLVTTRDAGDMVRFGVERFGELQVGSLSGSGRGLLLVVDPRQDRIRLEVGYALEGVFTDAFVAYVELRQMVPFFQANRVSDGILAATELIVQQAMDVTARNGPEPAPGLLGSGGAGATTDARIGQETARAPDPTSVERLAAALPVGTLRAYFEAMKARDGRSQLDLYSEDTQRMLGDWVMTPAQMDNVLRTYDSCSPEAAKVSPDGLRAVIRYAPSERRCSPWFFVVEQEKWRLDFTVMQEAIRFGRDNSWHFGTGVPGPYAFAFQDWSFDRHGFPVEP
jgi:uncharacterized protein